MLKKTYILIIFFIFMLLNCNSTFAMQVESEGKSYSIGLAHGNRNDITYTNIDGQKIRFSLDSNNILHLYNDNKTEDYLSFIYPPQSLPYGYYVHSITFSNPNIRVWEIVLSTGHAGTNIQYWLVGKQNGKWVTYVSTDSLLNMGGMKGFPDIRHEIIGGDYVIDFRDHNEWYRLHKPYPPYLRLALTWDNNAQWFGLKPLM